MRDCTLPHSIGFCIPFWWARDDSLWGWKRRLPWHIFMTLWSTRWVTSHANLHIYSSRPFTISRQKPRSFCGLVQRLTSWIDRGIPTNIPKGDCIQNNQGPRDFQNPSSHKLPRQNAVISRLNLVRLSLQSVHNAKQLFQPPIQPLTFRLPQRTTKSATCNSVLTTIADDT